jgi:hypothetical protein
MTNYQCSYNGLTFGGPTGNVSIVDLTGLEDLADIGSSDTPRPRDVGMLTGLDFPNGRTVIADLEIVASTGLTLAQSVDVAKAAFLPSPDTNPIQMLPLVFQLPGQAARLVNCRVRKRTTPVNVAYAGGLASMQVQFYASDPRIYAATASSGSCALPTPSSGFTFPVTFPLTFGGTSGSGGQIVATNAGVYPTRMVATVTGPCTSPSIQNATNGTVWATTAVLNTGDVLVADFDAHTIVLNGTGDRYYTLVSGSSWQVGELQPGSTTLEFFSADASPTGATLSVAYSSAWI